MCRILREKSRGRIRKLIFILGRIRNRGKVVEVNRRDKGRNNREFVKKSTNLLKSS